MTDQQRALNYMNYLAVDELLSLQRPVSDGPEHDELLFITIHQVYELWFKQLLHEIEQFHACSRNARCISMAVHRRPRDTSMTCVSVVS